MTSKSRRGGPIVISLEKKEGGAFKLAPHLDEEVVETTAIKAEPLAALRERV